MNRSFVFTCLLLAPCLAGCRPDLKRIADDHVQANILEHEKREAVPFFEEQGRLFDVDGSTNVDQQVVLPMLKQLQDVAATEQWVLLKPDKDDSAIAVLVQLPTDNEIVDRIADVVQAADDKFPGLILQQWGHEWLMMALIDQKAYEFLKKNKPDIEKQR